MMPGFLGGGQNAQPQQPRQPFGPQLKQALIAAAPLFSSMAAGYSSGRGPYAYMDQGIAGMQAAQKAKRDEEAAAAAAAAFGGLTPGGMVPGGLGMAAKGGGFPVSTAPRNPMDPTSISGDTMEALGKDSGTAGYRASLIGTESGGNWRASNNETGAGGMKGHFGRVQFGQARLQEAMNAGAIPQGTTPEQFMNSPALQIAAENWHFGDLESKLGDLAGTVVNGKPMDMGALVAMGHLGGAGGARRYVESGGQYNPSDSFGTSLADYAATHGGQGATMSAKGEGATPVDPMSDPYVQKLMGVMAMPGLTPEQKSVVQLQLESRIGQLTAPNPAAEEEAARARRARDAEMLGLQPGTAPFNQFVVTGEMPSAPKPLEVGGVLLDPTGQNVIFDSRQPKEGARPMTPQERAQWGIPETDTTPYKMTENGPVAIGSAGTTVNIDNAGGKFEEAFAKGDAATVETVYNAGLSAQRNLGRIDQLETLLANSPTGLEGAVKQAAGEWGVSTDGLDAIQSAQALINSLVPEQRQPGSGPMSDADLALFKQSLPRIINQPGGNKIIVDTMRAIAQYDAEGARIVQRLRNGDLTRAEAFDELQNRPNPLAQYSAGAAPAAAGAPAPGSVMKFDANGNVIP